MTHTRLRPDRIALAIAILAAFALAPSWPGAQLSVTAGSVDVGRGEPPVWTPAESGQTLAAGDRVRTGTDGRAEVKLTGATVRLYPNSMLKLPAPAAKGPEAVELREGTSLFDVLHRTDEPFEVRTPEVVVSVKGTRFAVALGLQDASVSVFRGLVGVRGDDQQVASELLVHPGFLAYGSDSFELSWLGADDPWDSWADGHIDPGRLQGERHEAALQDARTAALDLAKSLPVPASRDPGAEGSGSSDGDAKAQDNGTPERDPVVDAPEEIKRSLVAEIVEDVLNGPDGAAGGGGASGGGLDLSLLSGSGRSGPDVVQVLDNTTGTVWTFTESQLENIDDGDSSLPPDLLSVLNTQGVTDAVFTDQALSIFGKTD